MLMKSKVFCILAALSVIFLTLCSCDSIDEPQEENTSLPIVTDSPPIKQAYPVSFDNESFESSPQTVVSLSPALTSILAELSLTDRLVGVSEYCNMPGIEAVGSPAFPDMDKIIELSPELVISQSPIASADVVKLKQSGIRYLYLETPKSFSYLVEEYIKLAMIFYGSVDSQDIAAAALREIDERMTEAQNAGIDISFVIVNAAVDGKYAVSAGADIATDMLGVFGKNVLDGSEQRLVSKEEIEALDFRVIFADSSLRSGELDGVKADVIYIDMSEFASPTTRIGEIILYCLAELR